MISIGIDMVEIERIKRSVKNRKFIDLIFSKREIEELKIKNYNIQSIAASFCGKEAFSKAVGTGFRGFYFKDVEILHNSLGKPYIILSGNAKKLFEKNIIYTCISLTHTKNYASAFVLCNNIMGGNNYAKI